MQFQHPSTLKPIFPHESLTNNSKTTFNGYRLKVSQFALKISRAPKEKDHLPVPSFFRGKLAVKLCGVYYIMYQE